MSPSAFEAYGAWMLTQGLPLWSRVGVDPQGGMTEELSMNAMPRRPGYKRSRVHARQIYVFSYAHRLGVPGAIDVAGQAVTFLLAHGWTSDGGWAVKMGETGGIVDPDIDLYDQAFVIFALSHWMLASGDKRAIDWIERTLFILDTRLARPDGRGHLSRLDDRGGALQNPHMHLLEALLFTYEVAPSVDIAARIASLLALFCGSMFDEATATLGEYYTMKWLPEPGVRGRIWEPGHHYEWVWLLHWAQRLGFGTADPIARRMFDVAEGVGLRPNSGLIYDEMLRGGGVNKDTHRSWPQTERIKALIAIGEKSGVMDLAAIGAAIEVLMEVYLSPAPRGAWIDHVDGDGRAIVEKVPASTLYHLFGAYAEMKRVAPLLDKARPLMAACA